MLSLLKNWQRKLLGVNKKQEMQVSLVHKILNDNHTLQFMTSTILLIL